MQPIVLICVAASTIIPVVSSFYYKRTFYGDANANSNVNNYNNYNNYEHGGDYSPDYVNAYYGFPSYPPQEHRRRPSFGLYPPQNFFRHEHPFDFGPLGHRIGDANEQPQPMRKTDRERVMEKAKPGFWKQNGRGENTMNRVKKIINEKRMDMNEKHMQIRQALANEREEIRSKFADLHKRLIEKNFKMMATFIPRNKPSEPSPSSSNSSTTSTTVSVPESVPVPVPVPELSKQAKKIEKEAKKIMENKKMSIEKKQEKLDKLMLKAPDNVKAELVAINDSSIPSSSPAPSALPLIYPSQQALSALPLVQYPSQQSLSASSPSLSIVESRPIRISEDGQTVEI